jgi:signal-transduction protein with cAMP-binding, CBS, and nucleotidyltransferase domain
MQSGQGLIGPSSEVIVFDFQSPKEPPMATVREILMNKGSWVASIGPRVSALEAALAMNRHKVGSLMVMDGETAIGILTERDLLQRVLAEQRDAAKTPVEDVMTTEILCCQPHTTIEEARAVMKNRRVRHLPVVDQDGLHGLISIGDLNAYEAHSHEVTIHVLTEYIHGRA